MKKLIETLKQKAAKALATLKQKAAKAWEAIKETHFYQAHREEALAVPAVLLFFIFANWLGNKYAAGSAFFDIPSQLESLTYSAVRFCATIALAWIGIRIMAPPIYRYIVKGLYPGFDNLPEKEKQTATLALVITLLLCAAMSLKGGAATTTSETRAALIKELNTTIGIHETTTNAGPEVTFFLRAVKIYTPAPWCAAYVSFYLTKHGIHNPNTAWSPAFASQKDIIWTPKNQRVKPLAGDIPTYYNYKLKRVGHVGFYERTDPDGWFITIEGNTNGAGSFEGDCVAKKKRDPAKIHAIARFIK